MERVLNRGSGRAFTVHLDGFASHTGAARHNELLSSLREQAVEAQLRTALDLKPDLKPLVSFNRKFHGFLDSPPGEDPQFRSVRVVVTRPGALPPPVPVPQNGSKTFKIRLLFISSASSPVPIFPVQVDVAEFEIVNLKDNKSGRFRFIGVGATVPIPKLPFVSGGAIGNFKQLSITDPVNLRDFEGAASYGQPPGGGPISVAPSMLAIQSLSFRLKEAKTLPDPLPIDSSFSVGITIFSSTIGKLTLLEVRP